MEKKSKAASQVRVDLKPKTSMTLDDNLLELDKRIKDLKKSIKDGTPLSMGKTNLLSGLLRSLNQSMGAW